jgi:hypothetical protein
LLVFIFAAYQNANRIPLPNGKREAASRALFEQLDQSYPLEMWPLERLQQCVRNRFASEYDSMDPPHWWIPKLYKYRDGPLDRYGQPIRIIDQEPHEPAQQVTRSPTISRTSARNIGNAYAANEAVRILHQRRAEAGRDCRSPVPALGAGKRDG